jgi:hypothetical protein
MKFRPVSTDPTPNSAGPTTYHVVPSGRVNAAAKDLIRRAIAAGYGRQVIAALKELHRILAIYPQYGEPKRDLRSIGQTVYALSVRPLFVEYAIDEEERVVLIGVPFKVLPHSGFE